MLGPVFLKPLGAQFAVVKAVLDEVKDVLDPAAGVRFEPRNPLGQVFHLACRPGGHLAALGGDRPFHLPVLELRALHGAGITRIDQHRRRRTVPQVARRGDIRHVGGRNGDAVHQPGCAIDPEVGLVDAFKRSWAVADGQRFTMILSAIMTSLLSILGLVACCVGILPMWVLSMFLWAATYLGLRTGLLPTPARSFES